MLIRVRKYFSDLAAKVLWRLLKERQTAALTAALATHRQWMTEQGLIGAVDIGLRDGGAIVVISRIKNDRDFVKIIPINRGPMTVVEWQTMISRIESEFCVDMRYVDRPSFMPRSLFTKEKESPRRPHY